MMYRPLDEIKDKIKKQVKTHGKFRAFLGETAFVYLTAKRYIRVANAICVNCIYTRYVN